MKISITISEDFGSAAEVQAFADGLRVLCAELFRAKATPPSPAPVAAAQTSQPVPPVATKVAEPPPVAKVRAKRRSGIRRDRDARRTARRWRYPALDPSMINSSEDFRAAVGRLLEHNRTDSLPRLMNALYTRGINHITSIHPGDYRTFVAEIS